MKKNHSYSILDRYRRNREKMEASNYMTPGVSNTWVAGFFPLGKYSARIILGSSEPITPAIAKSSINHYTNNKLSPFVASFSPIKTENSNLYFASICASATDMITLPVNGETESNMSMISATTFMDTQLNKIWERKDIGGQQFFVRANDESPEDILRTTMLASTDPNYRINSNDFIITANAKVGDYVHFFGLSASSNGSQEMTPFMEVAQVEANEGNVLSVVIKENGYESRAKISAHACTTVIKSASEDTSRRDVIDFLSKIYPEAYIGVMRETYGN